MSSARLALEEWVRLASPSLRSVPKRQPKALINAAVLLAADMSDGKVGLGALGQYLKRTDPGFSPKTFGHAALSDI